MTTLLFPKPVRSGPRRRARITPHHDREYVRRRALCVDVVWARAVGQCECCGRFCVLPRYAFSPAQDNIGHVHEEPPRSLGNSGLDPDAALLLCQRCHDRRHRKIRPWLDITREGGTWRFEEVR